MNKSPWRFFVYMAPFLLIYLIWFSYPKTIYWPVVFGDVIGSVDNTLNSNKESNDDNTESGNNFVHDLGTFGDVFGSLNTLFSGLAFAGIIVSIRLQSKELEETRNEMKRQSEQFTKQSVVLNKQNFESTFFQMLSFNNQIRAGVEFKINNGDMLKVDFEKYRGSEAFKKIAVLLEDELSSILFDEGVKLVTTNAQTILRRFFTQFDNEVSHFYRNIYQTLLLIDNCDFSFQDKKSYSNILRSQISSYELLVLFYLCIQDDDHKKFRRLIEKYEFFEHLTQVDNIHDALFLFYDMSAYGWSNKKCHKKALISLVCSEVTGFDGAVEEITAYSYNAKTSRCEVVNIRDLSLVEREYWVKSGKILWVEKTIEYPSK
ncbi:putative phage abortive infection protein [Aeromonas allosaccharophila]|uniref:putative phage abortive infection protein n=1 Tax=Aeromonas allosaccharophila TaxID=656 RepID=UPI0036D91068